MEHEQDQPVEDSPPVQESQREPEQDSALQTPQPDQPIPSDSEPAREPSEVVEETHTKETHEEVRREGSDDPVDNSDSQ